MTRMLIRVVSLFRRYSVLPAKFPAMYSFDSVSRIENSIPNLMLKKIRIINALQRAMRVK